MGPGNEQVCKHNTFGYGSNVTDGALFPWLGAAERDMKQKVEGTHRPKERHLNPTPQ